MRQAVRDFGNELKRSQVGLFYFAGHGIQLKGSNYLVPVGTDIENEADAEDLSLDSNYVLRTMEEAQINVSVVILDACRNNPFARSFRSASRGLAQIPAATGSLVAFSTAPGSVAADGAGRNSVYTKHLLESLKQPDSDILQVFQRVRANVVRETGGTQTPWESTSLIGNFYFRPSAAGAQVAAIAPTQVREPPNEVDLKAAYCIPVKLWSSQGLAEAMRQEIRDYPHPLDDPSLKRWEEMVQRGIAEREKLERYLQPRMRFLEDSPLLAASGKATEDIQQYKRVNSDCQKSCGGPDASVAYAECFPKCMKANGVVTRVASCEFITWLPGQ